MWETPGHSCIRIPEREFLPPDVVNDSKSSTIRYIDVVLKPPIKDVLRRWYLDDLLIVLKPGAPKTTSHKDDRSDTKEFPSDIENVKMLHITKEFSWDEELQAPEPKPRVRVNSNQQG